MSEQNLQLQNVLCSGGLEATENHLLLSQQFPGAATRLINYEVSPSGGYKRILGYSKFHETYFNVDDAAAEGPILGLAIYKKDDGTIEYFAARKQQSGTTYKWYKFNSGSGWAAVTTGITHNTTAGGFTVNRIRHEKFNFGDNNTICFVDGVNKAVLYNGTSWIEIDSSATGADFANSGGPQALDTPNYVTVYENHLFLARGNGTGETAIVAHSAPNAAYDWTAGNGAGQIFSYSNVGVGFEINQIKPFRDKLYIFSETGLKAISVNSSTFVINNVTNELGCIASDSVVELGGDLMFLSHDGFRKIGGTSKIGDVDLSPVSVPIRPLMNKIVSAYDVSTIHNIVIRNKLQVRYFYGGSEVSKGIIGGIRFTTSGDAVREWGELYGITPSICTSAVVSGDELVIFGDNSGNIYTMEDGNSFNGDDIYSLYSPPYLDQGDPGIRKTYRKLKWFLRSEESFTGYTAVRYDWNDPFVQVPNDYSGSVGGISPVWDGIGVEWDGTGVIYDSLVKPIQELDIQGSAFSISPSFISLGTEAPHTIQGFIIIFNPEGRI